MLLAAVTTVLLASAPLPVVVVDAGHGGEHEGASGPCGAREKDVSLAVATELARLLAATKRVEPVLTRTGDETVDLDERYRIANRAGASLFLSIHANASTSAEARGVETFFLSRRSADRRILKLAERENDGAALPEQVEDDTLAVILDGLLLGAAHQESQTLALRVQQALESVTETRSRGVLQAPFIVLLGAQMPAALVEIGFLTHAEECELLAGETHQRRVAQALAAAVLAHLSRQSLAGARQ